MSMTSRNWAMLIHLSTLLGYAAPVIGLVVPILIWQLKKDEFPELDPHGKMVLNFIISMFIYSIVCAVLACVAIGILLYIPLAIVGIVFPIIGGIKANDGELWEYPLTLKLIK